MDWGEVGGYLLALLGGGTVGTFGVKWLNRQVDNATVEQIKVQAVQASKEATQVEVQTIREVLQEVRSNDLVKTEQISEYRVQLRDIKRRLSLVEERERHMLTRAAVHEAWDQMAFSMLTRYDSAYPPPPPLGIPSSLQDTLDFEIEKHKGEDYNGK